MPLRDTLNMLHESQRREQQTIQDRQNLIQEWKQAIESLYAQIRTYLAEYEKDSSLIISEEGIRLTEETLGSYGVQTMKIAAGPATIIIQPIGRMIIGAQGRVDMHRHGRATEQYRVMFLRMPKSATDATPIWWIRLPVEAAGTFGRLPPQERTVPFEKATLEQALDFLLN